MLYLFSQYLQDIFVMSERHDWHKDTYICRVSEDDALAVVVTNGLGGHGDGDE